MAYRSAKELLGEFVSLANTEPYFSMEDGDRKLKFCKIEVGKAMFVYGDYYLREEDFVSPTSGLKLAAILAGGITYIADSYLICRSGDLDPHSFPPNTKIYADAYEETKHYIQCDMVREYIDSLECPEECSPEILGKAEGDARKVLLGRPRESLSPYYTGKPEFQEAAFTEWLCGYADIEARARKDIETHEEYYVKQKMYEQALEKAIHGKTMVKPWETRMAESLQQIGLSAKTVTAQFSIDGNEYTEKLLLGNLLSTLQNFEAIEVDCFPSWNHGEEFLKSVHAYNFWTDGYRPLTHQDITTIKYRGKAIYEKGETDD